MKNAVVAASVRAGPCSAPSAAGIALSEVQSIMSGAWRELVIAMAKATRMPLALRRSLVLVASVVLHLARCVRVCSLLVL